MSEIPIPEEFNKPIEKELTQSEGIEFPHAEAGLEAYLRQYPNDTARAGKLRDFFQEFLQQEIRNIKIFKSEQLGAELPYTSINIAELATTMYEKYTLAKPASNESAPSVAAKQEFVFNSALSTDEGNEFNFVEEAMHEAVKYLPATLKALREGNAVEERQVFTLGMPSNVLGKISPELSKRIAEDPFGELGKVFAELVRQEMQAKKAKIIEFHGVSLSNNLAISAAENLLDKGLVTQDLSSAKIGSVPYLEIFAEVPVSLGPSKVKPVQVPVGFLLDALKEKKLTEVKRIEAGKPKFGKNINDALAKRGVHEQMSEEQRRFKRKAIMSILGKVGMTFKPKSETKITALYGLNDLTTKTPKMVKAAKSRKEEFIGTLGQNLLERNKPNERVFTAKMMHLSPRFRETQLKRMRVRAISLENLEQNNN